MCFSLYRWFCPLVCVSASVSFPCRDGLVMHAEAVGGSPGLSLSISVPLFTPVRHRPLHVDRFVLVFFFFYFSPLTTLHLHLRVSFKSAPVLSPHPSPLSFLHRKHFQGWHTRGDGCAENSATTIMSTLSSHNNTRINLPGEEEGGEGVAPSRTCLPWMECRHFTDLYLWKCEIWS